MQCNAVQQNKNTTLHETIQTKSMQFNETSRDRVQGLYYACSPNHTHHKKKSWFDKANTAKCLGFQKLTCP